MLQAADTVLAKYFTFSGRANRAEYWWWMLFMFLIGGTMYLVDAFLVAPAFGQSVTTSTGNTPASTVANLLLFLPSLTVSVRRLHDIDKSGLWLFVVFVPLIGALLLLYWSLKGGTMGSNDYGAPSY
ncbi:MULTISPECIES: DUF805 domain-containing protein [Stappiaceae]|uniref:DUF805 domain-containing protein n=1 Tax=Stappiaceae TaxID=2821832 RepID=UPI00129BB7D8|nr:DUF805 domain-containing protein [Labrenzia sp. CE80]